MQRSIAGAAPAHVRAVHSACAVFAALSFVAGERGAVAQAPDTKVCADAYVEGQKLRAAGRLVRARDHFSACMAEACPGWMVERCSRWRTEVTSRMPSVTLGARDANGRDLKDVTVTIDGAASPEALAGRAVALDPGEHRVRFERAGEAAVETALVVREGEPPRRVVVTLGAARADGADRPPVPAPDRPAASSPPVPVAAWLLGGLSLVAAGTSAVFAVRGANDRAEYGCDTGCAAPEYTDVRNQFIVANVALGVSVVSLGAAAWIFFATRGEHSAASSGAIAPRAAIERALVRF